MEWTEQDSIRYIGNDTITLFCDRDNEYMKFEVTSSLDLTQIVAKGTYLEFSSPENQEIFFAYSESDDRRFKNYKIYRRISR